MPKFRDKHRKDTNHNEIADEFRRLGCGVKDVHNVSGFADLLVAYRGVTVAVEVKDGSAPKSQQRLSEAEQEFSEYWVAHGGKYAVIKSKDEAKSLVNQMARA